jgi:TetR/AcrR family transcriptional repressor of nem operon
MMRYSAEHKQETRERIVHAASRRFRRAGAGVGIGQLMQALKLTHGGFYRHFRSKDVLLREAVTSAFGEMGTRLQRAVQNAPPERKLRALIETYLSDAHCANSAGGCPMAALISEAHRYPRSVRAAIGGAIEEIASLTARLMPGTTAEERRQQALVLFSGMAGTLAVARAVTDPELRRTILEAARKTYLEAFSRRR